METAFEKYSSGFNKYALSQLGLNYMSKWNIHQLILHYVVIFKLMEISNNLEP
jgi:hypothetical protein